MFLYFANFVILGTAVLCVEAQTVSLCGCVSVIVCLHSASRSLLCPWSYVVYSVCFMGVYVPRFLLLDLYCANVCSSPGHDVAYLGSLALGLPGGFLVCK